MIHLTVVHDLEFLVLNGREDRQDDQSCALQRVVKLDGKQVNESNYTNFGGNLCFISRHALAIMACNICIYACKIQSNHKHNSPAHGNGIHNILL